MIEPGSADAGQEKKRIGATARGGLIVGPVFFGLAAYIVFAPGHLDIPAGQSQAVHASQLDTAPRRQAVGDPPVIHLNGFDRTCMDCHRLFPASDIAPTELKQHRHIVLRHGINDRCRNCHYVEDRNLLVLESGEPVSYSRVTELCARCHGPTFRDWQIGAHGRSNGYWDVARGERRRLGCTECHDPHNPHSPAMDPLRPLPGPDSLRMGRPHSRDGHETGLDPLRRAILRAHAAASGEEGQ